MHDDVAVAQEKKPTGSYRFIVILTRDLIRGKKNISFFNHFLSFTAISKPDTQKNSLI